LEYPKTLYHLKISDFTEWDKKNGFSHIFTSNVCNVGKLMHFFEGIVKMFCVTKRASEDFGRTIVTLKSGNKISLPKNSPLKKINLPFLKAVKRYEKQKNDFASLQVKLRV